MGATARFRPGRALGVPLGLLLFLAAVIGVQTGLVTLPSPVPAAPGLAPETVTIEPRPYSTRAAGTFMREDGAILDAPLVAVPAPAPLVVMTHEVSVADYARCVNEGACRPAELRPGTRAANLPVTGVSFDDATAYAAWLSARTGESWRLPSLAEWDFAAGSLAPDEALGLDASTENPALRWIATYEQEAALGGGARIDPLPPGSGGVNEFGVADLAGAVWEWTSSCSGRTTVDAAGKVIRNLDSCGAHYLAGRHRTIMSDFIRDGATGGCATGRPPDNLGFRLVRAAPEGLLTPILRLFGA